MLLLVQGVAFARGYKASSTAHFIGLAAGGGEANDIAQNLHPMAGAAGNVTLFYEMHKNRVMVSVGLQAQYQYTRDLIAPFVHSFERTDIMGAVNYQYVYSNWMDTQTDIRMALPVRIGYQPKDYFYFLLGADLSLAVLSRHTSTADMYTQGLHAWDSKPMRSDEWNDFSANLGYYQSAKYSTSAPYQESMWVAPSVEIGTYIPLKSKASRLRAGLYANYGIRLGKLLNLEAVDYSAVDMSVNPNTQSQAFLQSGLVLNSALNSNQLTSLPGNLELGLRITYLMDVTVNKKVCMCMFF